MGSDAERKGGREGWWQQLSRRREAEQVVGRGVSYF